MTIPSHHLPSEDLPPLRDVLTDDGRELPAIRLTPTQLAEARAFVSTWGQELTCTCGHHYEDHQPPTESEWMRGGIAVREEHEECGICGCTDFEEVGPPCADCGRMDGGCDRTKEPRT